MLEYRMDIELKPEDFDPKGQVRPGAILHFFQEVAACHAEEMGIGYEDMIKDDLIWIITKLRYRVLAPMSHEGSYYVVTYPREKRSRVCHRDYYIYDGGGDPVVIGSSLWNIINYKTRKLERINFEYQDEIYDKDAFEDGFARLHMKEASDAGSYVITREDLDVNDHTNNSRYADLVQRTSGLDTPREFLIQFSKETRLGDTILLSTEPADGGELICGRLDSGETVFLAKVSV